MGEVLLKSPGEECVTDCPWEVLGLETVKKK